jgi:hypothetical protein
MLFLIHAEGATWIATNAAALPDRIQSYVAQAVA